MNRNSNSFRNKGRSTVPPVFIMPASLPTSEGRIDGLVIRKAVHSSIGEETKIACIQKVQGLWRIILWDRNDRNRLLINGIIIFGFSISIYGQNPFLINGEEGVKLFISNVHYSIADEPIIAALKEAGVILGSNLKLESMRDDEGKMLDTSTGRRFVFMAPPKEPLPEYVRVADTTNAYLTYRGMPERNKENPNNVNDDKRKNDKAWARSDDSQSGSSTSGSFSNTNNSHASQQKSSSDDLNSRGDSGARLRSSSQTLVDECAMVEKNDNKMPDNTAHHDNDIIEADVSQNLGDLISFDPSTPFSSILSNETENSGENNNSAPLLDTENSFPHITNISNVPNKAPTNVLNGNEATSINTLSSDQILPQLQLQTLTSNPTVNIDNKDVEVTILQNKSGPKSNTEQVTLTSSPQPGHSQVDSDTFCPDNITGSPRPRSSSLFNYTSKKSSPSQLIMRSRQIARTKPEDRSTSRSSSVKRRRGVKEGSGKLKKLKMNLNSENATAPLVKWLSKEQTYALLSQRNNTFPSGPLIFKTHRVDWFEHRYLYSSHSGYGKESKFWK